MEAGRGAKPMATASAPALKARASTPAPGTTALRWWEFTHGPAETPTRATGRRGSAMVWELRPKDTGFTGENGRMASRGGTACGSALAAGPSMKGRGITGFRMDTEQRRMRMEVRHDIHEKSMKKHHKE